MIFQSSESSKFEKFGFEETLAHRVLWPKYSVIITLASFVKRNIQNNLVILKLSGNTDATTFKNQNNAQRISDQRRNSNSMSILGPIIYFFDGRSPSRQTECLHLASALMKHFLKGIAPLRLWYINSEENFITLLIWVNVPNVLTEKFLQGNVLLRHLLDEVNLFMS